MIAALAEECPDAPDCEPELQPARRSAPVTSGTHAAINLLALI
jgi:hypothetical protein